MVRPHYLLLFLLLPFLAIACADDDDDATPGGKNLLPGSTEAVCAFVGETSFATLESFGFDFNEGTDPLDFTGTFLMDLLVQETSNIPGDTRDGDGFNTALFTFSDLEPASRSLRFRSTNEDAETTDTYYTTSGDDFTVVARLTYTLGSANPTQLYAISGTLTPDGLQNPQYAIIILDDDGDPGNVLLDVGLGRLLIDEDGLAVRR
ncbi:hypothetical protein [Lewinella sp. 4G2]|uniref:hypothetical protein n=1 Tax=Lewinella sp. 4G2 TaxID=1803372 RepID=UPI0007B46E45|nr:hypothetical protein [Lewinella sp. 4G2]OAV42571.1 hypothetical protein A3850_015090 [Lewinella sp. 4G2]